MIGLDKKDKKILFELDKNSRSPLTKIAKKVQLSRESILYRLNKYKENEIIRGFITVVDMAKLGFTNHKVFVKLHNITQNQEKDLINFLIKHPFISWVSSCDGNYSIIFAVKARSMIELDKVIKEIEGKYWKFIKEKDISTIISAHHFYRDYLINEKNPERGTEWGGIKENIKLDELNLNILDLLCKNPRATAVEISQKLHLSPDAIIQRIKNLEKSQVITQYMIWPNVNRLQGQYYKVLVNLHNINQDKEKQLASFCSTNHNIVYALNSLGPWQFEMDIEVSDQAEFRDIMRQFLNNFSELISDYNTLNIYNEYKFCFFEKEALEYFN